MTMVPKEKSARIRKTSFKSNAQISKNWFIYWKNTNC